MNRLCALLLLFAAVFAACAQSPDEQYVRIYQIIQEADRLNDAGQARAAAAKYVEAQEALTRFRGVYPGWNERVINYRLNYVTTKLAPLSGSLAAGTTPTPGTTGTNGPLGAASSAPPVTNAAAPPLPSNTAVAMSAEFDNQIKALQAEVTRLQTDNQRLSAKLKEALSVQPATIDPRELAKAEDRIRSLLKENELFKTQLAQRSTNPAAASPDLSAKVAEQTEVIAALRAENEVLKKQSAEWRGKYEVAQSDSTKAPPADVQAAVRRLTEENVSLTKQVALWKEVAQSNQRQTSLAHIPSMPSDAQRELLALRARVQTLEASPVPYTPEELALFNKPPPTLVANVTATSPRPNTPPPSEGPLVKPAANVTRGVPTGAGVLVRTAERAFATGHYQEAQQKYVEVLQQEPNNITMLCNLASAQLELGDIPEAEKNVQRARELDPNDYFALYLLGRIRFRQEKLDESLEALSRSVKANPDYADTQNYLGIVLSEKGLRGPAEAALRKAIQLQPNNAVAHNNLAIVYATQTPPALALARWHYKKALDAGHPPNAELEKLLRQ